MAFKFIITGFTSLVAVLVGLFGLFIWVGPVGLVLLSSVIQSNLVTDIVTNQAGPKRIPKNK